MKREVYNGYEEYYMTGREIKKHFDGCYETFGRHHSIISSKQIDFDGKYLKISDDKTYRLFINNHFCAIFDDKTDKKKHFFGYTKNKPDWAKEI